MKQPEDQKTGDLLDSISQIERGIAAMSREAAGAGAMIGAAAQPDVIDVVPGVVTTNAAAVAEAHDAVTALTDAQREAQRVYGDGQTYHRERVLSELRFWTGTAAQAWMEMGKRLILIKAHEPHGGFKSALEMINIHPRTAQRMMLAAQRFMAHPAMARNADKFLALGTTKILDLCAESDETIEKLAENQPLLTGLTLDDMARMPRTEMGRALRDEREAGAAKDRLIATKNDRINELERQLTQPYQPKAGSLAQTRAAESVLRALQEQTAAAVTAAMQLKSVAADIAAGGELGEAGGAAVEGAFGYLIATIRTQVNELGLLIDTSNEQFGLAPDWLTR